jgi:hypothetical protein
MVDITVRSNAEGNKKPGKEAWTTWAFFKTHTGHV